MPVRFMADNLVTDGSMVRVSSARPGLVGLPAPDAQGSAVAYAAGSHTGQLDQVFVVEIDGLGGDGEVGNATFRWRRADSEAWEATGVATSASLVELADGVQIKWVGGSGQDFYVGDRWTILATRPQGGAALVDSDRDTAWEATGCAAERIALDLGESQEATALVLGDHNLSAGAQITLEAGLCLDLDFAAGEVTDRVSMRELVCLRDDPVWGLVDGVLTEIPANTPALVDDPAGGGGKALMASPPSTNLVEQSQDLSHEWWHKTRCSFAGPVEGPTGEMTGLGLVGTAELDTHYLYSEPIFVAPYSVLTLSCFARPERRQWLELRLAYYDASSVFTGGESIFVEVASGPYNGWSRYQATMTVPAGTATLRVILRPAAGDGAPTYSGDGSTADMYLTGVQLEELYAAGPYVPTAGAAASRSGETLYLPMISVVAGTLADSGSLRTEAILGFEPVLDETFGGIVSTRNHPHSLLYYNEDPGGPEIKTFNGSILMAGVDLDWAAGQAYDMAVRWRSASQSQVGADATWGTLRGFGEGYATDSPARLYLAVGLVDGPMYFRRVQMWDHWDDAATPAEVGDAYTETLTITSPHLVHFMEHEARSWLITILDPDNPDGLITAGQLYLGGHFQPSRGFDQGYTRGLEAARSTTTTDAGKLTGSARALAEQLALRFTGATPADVAGFQELAAGVNQVATTRLRPLWFIPFTEADPMELIYCLPPARFSWTEQGGGRFGLALTLEEVIKSG